MNKTRFEFIEKNLRLSKYDRSTAERAADKMWKVRDAFAAVRNTIHKFMPRSCGKASVDETRVPYIGKAPCIQVLKLKPVKQRWTFWCAVDLALGFCFNIFIDDDSLRTATAAHLPWGMTGETVMRIVREHKKVGIPDAIPYQHCQWAMDN
eukprot:8413393-Ditylum_brightwellii.AAC.1